MHVDEKATTSTGFNITTYKGNVSMDELNEKVFKQLGYEIAQPTEPIPKLRMFSEPTCENVFSEWLKVAREPQPDLPPIDINSQGRSHEFLLFGYSAISSWYINDKNSATGEKTRNWDKISELMEYPIKKLADLAYGTDSVSMFNAMAANRLDGKRGAVIGSMQPWVEVMALRNGAKKVLTVEYFKLEIQEEFKDRLSSILPFDFAQNWQTYSEHFDFVASFSSIEHSGLGRYGDPLDPIGDLREMLKIKCILKKGGLLFLGLPQGIDAIQYNAHRIYGPIRLALMLYGFELIGTFAGEHEESFELTSAILSKNGVFGQKQYTLVLRKIR